MREEVSGTRAGHPPETYRQLVQIATTTSLKLINDDHRYLDSHFDMH
jgi:hypothetical protein